MNQANGEPGASEADIVRMRQEISETRDQLGETVQALAARADVKARAREATAAAADRALVQARTTASALSAKASELNSRVGEHLPEPVRYISPFALLTALAFAAAAVVGTVTAVRRRKGRRQEWPS